jgi:hypothetical protein
MKRSHRGDGSDDENDLLTVFSETGGSGARAEQRQEDIRKEEMSLPIALNGLGGLSE